MTTTFLTNVLRNAQGKTATSTVTIKTKDDLRGLSYYTICALADTMGGNPFSIAERGEVWTIDLDSEGNFLRAECLGHTLERFRNDLCIPRSHV